MSSVATNPREVLLQLCAEAAPEPWYPRLFAKSQNRDLAPLVDQLEEMWLDGLIEKGPGTPETGPAITLTPLGQQVLHDPELLQRLRDGEPLREGDYGARVRQRLRSRRPPWVTRLFALTTLLVFAAEIWLVRRRNLSVKTLLFPEGKAPDLAGILGLLQEYGFVGGAHFLEHEWWRFVTAGFVHFGLLHIGLGLLTIYLAGRTVERMWGPFGCLVLYLSACVGGFITVVAKHPEGGFGSAPAWAGLCAAEVVWFVCYRKHLTRALRRQAFTGLFSTLFMLAIFSFLPGDPARIWELIGGGVTGAVVAGLLFLREAGSTAGRWLAPVLFAMLPVGGYWWVQHAHATHPKLWEDVEVALFNQRYLPGIQRTVRPAWRLYRDEVRPVVEKHPTRREPAEVEGVRPDLEEQRRRLLDLCGRLSHAGPFYTENVADARPTALAYAQALADLFALADEHLQKGEKHTSADRQALQEQTERVEEAAEKWNRLLEPAS
jgi:membrane associated rhomboid family serine protease